MLIYSFILKASISMTRSIDKTSIREQFDEIKDGFNKLSQSGSVSEEIALLFKSLFALVEIILAVFMEKQTKKTKNNSGIPSSQSDPDESTHQSNNDASRKKRKPTHNEFDSRYETVTIETLDPGSCSKCHTDLTDEPASSIERRTLIDIRFEKVVHHIDALEKSCPNCEVTNKPKFPKPFAGPLQYGTGIKAFVLNLLVVQMVALNRVQSLVTALIDQVISEATMLKYVLQLHQALEKWERDAFNWLLEQLVVNVDETSIKIDKIKQWIHVYASGPVTLKKLERGRGKKAINNINFIPQYKGVIVHDCLAAYFSYDHCEHGICGSHLLRELQFIVDSNKYLWARQMKRLLKHVCRVVSARTDKKLTSKEYEKLIQIYRSILEKGEKELPEVPAKPKNKRGRIAKSDAHNLWERLSKREQAVLLFSKKSEVPFTNNRAERDLRMAKVKQKVSGCFRKVAYAEAYCRISSYLQTMAAKGYNPMLAIEMALSGELYKIEG